MDFTSVWRSVPIYWLPSGHHILVPHIVRRNPHFPWSFLRAGRSLWFLSMEQTPAGGYSQGRLCYIKYSIKLSPSHLPVISDVSLLLDGWAGAEPGQQRERELGPWPFPECKHHQHQYPHTAFHTLICTNLTCATWTFFAFYSRKASFFNSTTRKEEQNL